MIRRTVKEQQLLSEPPVDLPPDYRSWVNTPDKDDELQDIRASVAKGKPFGPMKWTEHIVSKYGLELTTRKRGRSKKGT